MEQQFDAQAMMQRASEVARAVRKSEAYPALIGGIAGGVAGALMAVIVARRVASSRPATVEETVRVAKSDGRDGWSAREVIQLATVVAALAKQAQGWYASRKEQHI